MAWFKAEDQPQTNRNTTERAAAALLLEVALADDEFSDEEKASLPALLRQHTQLTTQEAMDLLEIAHEDVESAVAIHEFTRHLNETFTLEEKLDLLTTLWRVAYADQHIDKYEEHVIRKVADLLHLRHSEFIQCKHKAMN